ncbi:MAG: Rne/Rng family ribonuclease [Bacteroidia bacterium]|nr:Rne/Rng family ribonuclease [Bacteroidia bacterium]
MNYELIINSVNGEITIALLKDKGLVEIHKEKGNSHFAVGDIYLGKVKKVMTGLNAAFVDVGYEKDAFLHYLDLGPQAASLIKYTNATRQGKQNVSNLMYFKSENDIRKEGKINEILQSGMQVMVQVAKEPISQKGPRITSEISLAGRYIVLIPFSDKVSVSQKIRNSEEKARLRELIHKIKPKNFGVIVRTVADGKTVADIEGDMNELMGKWEELYKNLKTSQPPLRVLGEINRKNALLRDLLNANFNNIHVNDPAVFEEIKEYIKTISPDKVEIVKLYTGKFPIFDHFGIEKQIKSLFGKTVHMKSGAYLHVEHTEALHVIDVNSGNRAKSEQSQENNAYDVNVEAAIEVARQLRLRDMGGIIVIDFIDMHNLEHRRSLFDKLKEEMKGDRAKHNILPPSKFGLVQITRQRVRPEMNIEVMEVCPNCQGTGKSQPAILLIEKIENTLGYIVKEQNQKDITLQVHPYLEAYITKGFFWKSILHRWKKTYSKQLKLKPIQSYGFMEFRFFNSIEDEIVV